MKAKSGNQIKLGMILSYLNIGIGNLIPLFYTPIMLSLLGQSEYGLYKISSSTTSYLSLLTFGIGGAVTRYLIKANTESGKEAEENVFGLFNLIFQGIAVLTIIIGGVLTLNLGLFYSSSLTDGELVRMQILVGIMVVNTAVGFSATSYNSVVCAHERFIFMQIINIISTTVVPIANLVVLFIGYKSIGMVISSLTLNVITRIMYIIYVKKSLHLKPRYNNLPYKMIKEIFVFSFWIFVANVVGQLYKATDVVIIGMIPSLATVGAAVYSVGYTFPNIMFGLAQATPTLFMPRANKMVFNKSSDTELTDLVIKVGRSQAFIVALVCFGFIAFGKPFLNFYAGPEYLDGYWVAVIIMIPNCIPLVQSAANSIIQAKNKHRFRSIVYIILAICNVFATWFFVQEFGIIGAAIPTGTIYFIGNGLIMNWYYWKKIHLDILRFWKNILPIFLTAAVMCVIALLLSNWIDFYNIYTMLAGIIIFALIFCLVNWLFVMNDYEKDIFKKPLNKVIKKFKRGN